MRIAVLTNNSVRHKYLANMICEGNDEYLVVCEITPPADKDIKPIPILAKHFALRDEAETEYFSGHDWFKAPTLPLIYKELRSPNAYRTIKNFDPEIIIIFGASIIKEPLLSLLPHGRMLNLHLGLSPYYRGSGTNFWPFVNAELEYVGSTILCLDQGIDTGDIVANIAPEFEIDDTAHTVGCKVIKKSVAQITEIIEFIKKGRTLRTPQQWAVENPRYYRQTDFTPEVLDRYLENLKNGLVEKFIKAPKKPPRLIHFPD